MSGLIIYGTMAALLFSMAFVSRRRVGAPILGLAAGLILSHFWASNVSNWLISRGARMDTDFLASIIEVSIVMLPAALLMLHGGVNRSTAKKLLSAAIFTLVALAVLVEPIQRVVVLGGPTDALSDFLITYRNIVIAAGLIVAVIDLTFTKIGKVAPKKGKH